MRPLHRVWLRCDTTGKRGYQDKRAAKSARNATDKGMRVYPCEHCGRFHIGHVIPGKPREAMRRVGRDNGDNT